MPIVVHTLIIIVTTVSVTISIRILVSIVLITVTTVSTLLIVRILAKDGTVVITQRRVTGVVTVFGVV
jgi:hypothetical protein